MITAVVCLIALTSPADYRKNLTMYMEADRAYARSAALAGYRAASLEWFAPDGLFVSPTPVKYRTELENQPVETRPYKALYTWEPKIADCAGTGDLGFTAGTSKRIDLSSGAAPAIGAYLSVWQKQPDGSLRIIFHVPFSFATAPVFPDRMKVQGPPSPAFVTMDLVDRSKQVIRNGEEDISKSGPDELARTYSFLYNKEVVIFHPQGAPLQSSAEGLKWFTDHKLALELWKVEEIKVAVSSDLAFVWGTYGGSQDGNKANGVFAHIWKSEVGKGWHIIAEVRTANSATN